MTSKPTDIPTFATADARSINLVMSRLIEAHERGEVKSIVATYFNQTKVPHTISSSSATLGDIAYAIALWQSYLLKWLRDEE